MADFSLQVIDLRKAFTSAADGRIEVLRGVDLSASAGEMIAITGASGSGKSTLLHLLGGLEDADHGTIFLERFSITQMRGAALVRLRRNKIGFVFQFHHLLADLTAAENVALPLMIARTPALRAAKLVNIALNDLGLAERSSHPVGHLSGGEQQRVAVARAFITEPRLVLADEPTGNLDAETSAQIGKSLHDYCIERGAIVIVATHNESLARLCDRILTIQHGRLHPKNHRHGDTKSTE